MTTLQTSPAKAAPSFARQLQSVNPATGEVVGSVPITPAADVPAVVQRARAAQPTWAATPIEQRADMLRAAGRTLLERADELGALMTDEQGKPLSEAVGEVQRCGSGIDGAVESIIEALRPEQLEDEHTRSTIHYDPLGVAAAIAPWNFPLAMPHVMVIPALMAGNTVVLKPSEETPLIAQAYADILNESLPEGVLHVVHGADDQGKALVDADVDLIAFTGSRETGAKIMAAASRSLKRLVLELGGKDPMIVLDDADLDAAVQFAVHNSFRNAGQVCVSTERIYVHERIAEKFERMFLERAAALKVGRGTEDGVNVGPMVNAPQRDHVIAQVRRAIEQGATLATGEPQADGPFIRPIVLTNLTHEMDIMRAETFGPVACIMRVRDDDEAVRLANDTPFGLGAAVYGGDVQRASAVARRLTAGMIGVNKSCGGAAGCPWVGAQQSGFGHHSGVSGHRQFAQARVISIPK